MAERTYGNLGLKAGYNPGEDGWGASMTLNILKLSVLAQGRVLSKVSAEPGSPTQGDAHILDETHATHPNDIAVYDNSAWVYIDALTGWKVWNAGTSTYLTFNGTIWTDTAVTARYITMLVSDPAGAAMTVGDGKAYFPITPDLNGKNLTAIRGYLITASSSGDPTFQIYNMRAAADMLSTNLSIDATETDSAGAAVPAVIDAAHDDVLTGDLLRVDCDVAGTGAKGLIIVFEFT